VGWCAGACPCGGIMSTGNNGDCECGHRNARVDAAAREALEEADRLRATADRLVLQVQAAQLALQEAPSDI